MSLGPVMLDLEGQELMPEERERLLHPQVGGVILFSRNYESPTQISRLIESIQQLREPRLLVAVDQEGGRIQRFRSGFTALPASAVFGELYAENSRRAKRLAETCGWLMATELRSVGVDFSFAPVLDLRKGISAVIGDRAYHADPQIVAELGQAYMNGMSRAGMPATGKHFPGHGNVVDDSHHSLPVDNRSLADIYTEDLVPFERMIRFGIAGIMPAHVLYERVDENPACFSRFWLQKVLRQDLQFQGAIFSDDLSMAAAATVGDIVGRAQAALDAGCDMILVCNDPVGAASVLSGLDTMNNPTASMRLVRMRGRQSIARMQLQNDGRYKDAMRMVKGIV